MTQREWQPIETAPKDQRWLLFGGPKGRVPYVGRWFVWAGLNAENGFWQSHCIEVKPTHWMPLPDPPQEQP